MKHSETIAQIAAALVAAQAEMPSVTKNATNPAFRSKFANLDGIVDTVKPVLARHKLTVLQSGGESSERSVTVETMLIHESGEWLMSSVTMPVDKPTAQGVGSAITYGRRYGLSALLSLATDEDDDANAASKTVTARPAKSATTGTVRADTVKAPQTLTAHDHVVRGKKLGDHTKEELMEMQRKLRAEGNANHKQLLANIVTVLNDRVLTPKSIPATDDNARVAHLNASVEKEDAELQLT